MRNGFRAPAGCSSETFDRGAAADARQAGHGGRSGQRRRLLARAWRRPRAAPRMPTPLTADAAAGGRSRPRRRARSRLVIPNATSCAASARPTASTSPTIARGDRVAVVTYLRGQRAGIYTFTAGRLSSIERGRGRRHRSRRPQNPRRRRSRRRPDRGLRGPTSVSPASRRLVIFRTRRQPFFLGPLQRARRAGARLAELGGLFRIAREQIRQRQRGVDLGDDAADARDLGLGVRNPLLQRRALFALAALRACRGRARCRRDRANWRACRAPTAPCAGNRRGRRR